MRKNLRKFVEENRYFEFFVQIMIVLSVILYTFDTFEIKSENLNFVLGIFELIFIFIFTIEYILRVYSAENRTKYIFSFYGIIDFLSFFPFYLSFGFKFSSFKIFRVFRLFRLFKLLRYNKAFNRLKAAAGMAKEEIFIFGFIAGILIYFSAIGIYHFEHEAQPQVFSNIFDSLYWAVITLTTVGYGDITPITMGGRFFTLLMLSIGVGIITIPAGLVSSAMTQAKKLESLEADASFKINTEKVKDEVSSMIK